MRERPILFSTEMVQAILDGRKTQTRRVLKNAKLDLFIDDITWGYTAFTPQRHISVRGKWVDQNKDDRYGESFIKCPYGKVGDRLWVREAWCKVTDPFAISEGIGYKADMDFVMDAKGRFKDGDTVWNFEKPEAWKFKPSIHMPRWASRITLEITNIRVERIHDISIEDIIAEGCSTTLREGYACEDLREQFSILWDSINAKRGFGWSENPWVWVIKFQKIDSQSA